MHGSEWQRTEKSRYLINSYHFLWQIYGGVVVNNIIGPSFSKFVMFYLLISFCKVLDLHAWAWRAPLPDFLCGLIILVVYGLDNIWKECRGWEKNCENYSITRNVVELFLVKLICVGPRFCNIVMKSICFATFKKFLMRNAIWLATILGRVLFL